VSVGTVKSSISRTRDKLETAMPEARVIKPVSRENGDAVDFILGELRDEKKRIDMAIASLEQLRPMLVKS
jgi:hypothetical protein